MNTKAIIFDFFGVICSEIAPFWFEKYFPQDEVKRLKNLYAPPADLGEISEDEYFSNIGKLVQKTTDEVRSEFENYVKIDDGVVDLIKKLKPTYKIGLCSNSPSNFIRTILENHNLTELFDDIVISSECGIIKPDQRIYALILEKLMVEEKDTIFIDDNPVHTDAARAIGIETVLFSDAPKLNLALADLGIKVS